mgnify:CR=1 FL=1
MTLKDNKLLATILNPRVVLVAYISFKTLQYAIAVTYDERSVIYLASLASHCVIAFFAFKNIRWALLMMSVMVGIPGLMGFVMGVSAVPGGVTFSSAFYAVFGVYCVAGGIALFLAGQPKLTQGASESVS